jgi:hypothetical protein
MKTIEALEAIIVNQDKKALNYCVNYAIEARRIAIDYPSAKDELVYQLRYVLGNMTHWRGDLAKEVRATLKEATK